MPKSIGRNVLLKIHTKNKEEYALTDDVTISISRGYEFNRRIDFPSYGVVISAPKIPTGAEILVHHNSTDESYLVPMPEELISEAEIKDGWKVYSIDPDMCFVYRTGDEWEPCEDYLITLRIFEPYKGVMAGIPNQRVENRLYILKGKDTWDGKTTDLKNTVMVCTPHSDYEIIYHNEKHREERIIRTRHREITARDFGTESRIKKNELLLGLNENDCKNLKEINEKKHSQDTAIIQ